MKVLVVGGCRNPSSVAANNNFDDACARLEKLRVQLRERKNEIYIII